MYTNIIHNDDICNYFLKNQQFIFNSLGNCRECRLYGPHLCWCGFLISLRKKIEAIVRKTHFEEFKAAHTGESHFFLKKNDFCCFLRSGLRSTKTFSIVEGFRPV